MNNEYSIVLLGNGLDLALGKKTKIDDFLNWINKNNNFKSNGITKEKHDLLKKFIEIYQMWCDHNKISNKNWSNIEKNIVDFFYDLEVNTEEFKKKIKNKIRTKIFEKLKLGYEIFCFLMQEYYIKELKQRINKPTTDETSKKLLNVLNWLKLQNDILSLNYTNLNDFLNSNTNVYKRLPIIKIYFLHFISFGVSFYEYLENLLSINNQNENKDSELNFLSFGNATTKFNFFYSNIDLLNRNKFTKPHKITKLKTYINPNQKRCQKKCNSCCLSPIIKINKIKKYYQLLILGNSNDHTLYKNEKYNFLSKNNNPNLFIQNYPNFILEQIKQKTLNINNQSKVIYIFGYSFGQADKLINDFLVNLLKNEFKIQIVFFESDKNNCNLLKDNYTLYTNFLSINKINSITYEDYINNIKWL